MQDVTTQVLQDEGYAAFKYIPYGPLSVCIPYLGTFAFIVTNTRPPVRRAQENSDVIQGTGTEIERKELWRELLLRLGVKKD